MSHPIVHWEIGGRDAKALLKFYGGAFGWTMTDAGPEYTLVSADGGIGGGIMQVSEGVPPHVTVYIRADDLEAKLAEIEELGGKTIMPPKKIDETMSFALFADPEGTVIGLLQQTPTG